VADRIAHIALAGKEGTWLQIQLGFVLLGHVLTSSSMVNLPPDISTEHSSHCMRCEQRFMRPPSTGSVWRHFEPEYSRWLALRCCDECLLPTNAASATLSNMQSPSNVLRAFPSAGGGTRITLGLDPHTTYHHNGQMTRCHCVHPWSYPISMLSISKSCVSLSRSVAP